MDLQATAQLLGNIGEFLSAFLVLVTLLYLALQVKHARNQLQTSVQYSRLQAIRDNWLNRSQNAELLDAIVKAEEKLGSVFLNHGFVRALMDEGGLTAREALLVFIDQQVQWQNWVNTIENLDNQAPNSLARMHAGIRLHYKQGYGRLFWERQRRVEYEALPITYIEKVLADEID